ncbi:hypothetical protein GC173_04190 [bacterium]|nr:hypothetical protein [bacterium]
MKKLVIAAVLAGCLIGGAGLIAQDAVSYPRIMKSAPAPTVDPQVQAYRKEGQAGMDRLMAEHAAEIADRMPKLRSAGPTPDMAPIAASDEAARTERGAVPADADWEKTRTLIDSVSGQCDGWTSGLFWHNDFNEARAESQRTGRPLLQLHMLGKLSDEVSCANSRYFRTTVYSDPAVAKYLRENFVLCWSTFRAVPVITVDYGDGRRIERTVTGNSAHAVIDTQGRVVDVLPGLYSAGAFMKVLEQARTQAVASAGLGGEELRKALTDYHAARDKELAAQLQKDREAVALDRQMPITDDEELWKAIAGLPQHAVEFSPESISLVAAKNPPTAQQAMLAAMSKSMVETPLVRMTRNLKQSVALDTVKNEYVLHAAVHRWYIDGTAEFDPMKMRNRVYKELFLMPANDPWLGMAPPDTFSALPQNGIVEPRVPVFTGDRLIEVDVN